MAKLKNVSVFVDCALNYVEFRATLHPAWCRVSVFHPHLYPVKYVLVTLRCIALLYYSTGQALSPTYRQASREREYYL